MFIESIMRAMQKRPLYVYVIGAAIVWAFVFCVVRFLDPARFPVVAPICSGFFLGMLAMYIAVHFYRWK